MNSNKKSKGQTSAILLETEDLFNEINERVRDVIFSLSSGGEVVTLSKSYEKITGWEIGQWIGKSFLELIHPEDIPMAKRRVANVLKGNSSPVAEIRILKKSGEYVCGEILSSPLMKNGKIVGILGIAHDITEHKLIIGAMRNSEENFHVLFEENPMLTILSEIPSGKITFANKRLSDILDLDLTARKYLKPEPELKQWTRVDLIPG